LHDKSINKPETNPAVY